MNELKIYSITSMTSHNHHTLLKHTYFINKHLLPVLLHSIMEPQCVIQPRRLKDFLQDQNLQFPRPRSRNRKSTISLFLHAAVKSSSILRRRFSNKNRSSSRLPEPTMSRTTSVTVKDILRWKSFRDLVNPVEVSVPMPSDFTVESPSRCTTTTTSEGTPRSSWCDSDFTVGDSPVWCRGFAADTEVTGKKNFRINVAGDERLRQNTREPKDRIVHEEEQFSPISVLDFTQEHEETFSSFHQILANMERRNIMLKQRIQHFENLVNEDIELDDTESFKIEEKAIQLMDRVKKTSSIEDRDSSMDCLLLDFFRDELMTRNRVKNITDLESRVLKVANSWVRGEDDGSLEGTRLVCVGEMEKKEKWNNFEDEQQEIGIEIEKIMLNQLLDELSMDLLNV